MCVNKDIFNNELIDIFFEICVVRVRSTRQAGLGARVDAAALVAQGPALGQRAHGRAHRGRETEGTHTNTFLIHNKL